MAMQLPAWPFLFTPTLRNCLRYLLQNFVKALKCYFTTNERNTVISCLSFSRFIIAVPLKRAWQR
jgi:hypothetical protein